MRRPGWRPLLRRARRRSPVHVVVAVQVLESAGHLARHALQGQRVGRQGLGHPAAPQVALEVPLATRAARVTAGGHRGPGADRRVRVRVRWRGQCGVMPA